MLAVILGLVFVLAGAVGVYVWKGEFLFVLKGLVPFMLVIGGAISIVAGLTNIIESFEKKEESETADAGSKPK